MWQWIQAYSVLDKGVTCVEICFKDYMYCMCALHTYSTTRCKNISKMLSLGMAQGSTKKSRNKKMAYTHHNDAMTSAHNTIQHLWCISHGIVMMSVSHFLVSRLFGASLSHS